MGHKKQAKTQSIITVKHMNVGLKIDIARLGSSVINLPKHKDLINRLTLWI